MAVGIERRSVLHTVWREKGVDMFNSADYEVDQEGNAKIKRKVKGGRDLQSQSSPPCSLQIHCLIRSLDRCCDGHSDSQGGYVLPTTHQDLLMCCAVRGLAY